MPIPPLVVYATPEEYRIHFERAYCVGPLRTFDGILVHFRKQAFDHCMFESSARDGIKDMFSTCRAERIDWIQATLSAPNADLYVGWDNSKKCADSNRRVAVVFEDYVVVIWLRKSDPTRELEANFVTAYKADNSIRKIRQMPRWTRK